MTLKVDIIYATVTPAAEAAKTAELLTIRKCDVTIVMSAVEVDIRGLSGATTVRTGSCWAIAATAPGSAPCWLATIATASSVVRPERSISRSR
ncbi:MAG: hypothetical protein HC794_04790 [Nitrospiraceae bacterium]|nr:hypothetical protein [Nitrospiraceae bacterium]